MEGRLTRVALAAWAVLVLLFLFVPKGAVHREGNPGETESHLVVTRAGTGPPVINVEGPAPG